MGLRLTASYQDRITSGALRSDPDQLAALGLLEDIKISLERRENRRLQPLSSLFRRSNGQPETGLYIWGSVGGGKSMLMDLFFEAVNIQNKRRVHFHAFMQDIHNSIFRSRQSGLGDPISAVAEEIIDQTDLLCLDEMQITDITDAMIVGRLFQQLINGGVTLVTTSNRPPGDLYKDGLNRQLFRPFIELIQAKLTIAKLKTARDYRQDKIQGIQTYFTPISQENTAQIDLIWQDLTQGQATPLILKVKSRDVILPLFHNGVARADFGDLCQKPLGPADHLAIADATRVLILDNIPRMSRSGYNEAKRFITLIDTLYEAKTRLICSAAALPEDLYFTGDGAFEFARTASRLREMQGAEWGS